MKIHLYISMFLLYFLYSSCASKSRKTLSINKKPEEMKLTFLQSDNYRAIDSLMQKSRANGAILKDGILLKEWTYDKPVDTKIEVQSITKSVLSLLLGLALDDKLIRNINDKVIDYYPNFSVGPYTNQITFKHLVTISSGIEAKKHGKNYGNPNNMPPGKDARYHNDHFHQLAIALTYIFEEKLIHVLNKKILVHLNASIEWGKDGEVELKDGRKIPVNAGYAFSKWTSADLAKFGYLYLKNGEWEGKQLISKSYIQNTFSPIDIPLMISRPNTPLTIDCLNTYGYGFRGILLDQSEILWHASGNGGQFCAIIPQKDMVFVKINGYSDKYKPYTGLNSFKKYLL